MREETKWGYVDWQENEASQLSRQGMNVGTVTVNAGMHLPRHMHYDEQIFYALQGNAIMLIDDQVYDVKPGLLLHWKAGVYHEVYCTGDKPFSHLTISCPTMFEEDSFLPAEDKNRHRDQETRSKWLYQSVEAIRTQFLETLQYPYAIFDLSGNIVIKNKILPHFCRHCCNPLDNAELYPCMLPQNMTQMKKETMTECPYGLTVYRIPITFQKQLLGYIQGGYVQQSGSRGESIDSVYESTQSAAISIQNLLRRIAKALRNYCEFAQFHEELIQKDKKIETEEQSRQTLMESLKGTQYTMTDLRINNHFLFNTLNSMATMAVKEDNLQLYQSILDLSKLFRYNLQYTGNIVTFQKEIEYLKAYLELQKLRHKKSLQIVYDIDPKVNQSRVPYNILQPIAENAFKHGFADIEEKRITIHAKKIGEFLDIRICNTGKIMDESEIERINQYLKNESSHGLTLVNYKLASLYGADYLFEILSDQEKGTRFHLRIPFLTDM